MKSRSASLAIRELQTRTTVRYHLTPLEWLELEKKKTKISVVKEIKKLELPDIADEKMKQ